MGMRRTGVALGMQRTRPLVQHFFLRKTLRILFAISVRSQALGEHKNGEMIAVKVLHNILGLDDEQFEKEYLNIASLQHKNIVRLVGYCHETQRECLRYDGKMVFADMTQRALCFEYMHKGSLDKYLSDEFNGHDWRTCYAIIQGICQGLKYLHEELHSPMYHLDIKPVNVLLDENMVPKLADFGLSRLFGGEKTQVTKNAIGTHGYVPPEYIDSAVISNKFDIFSLGVVIIKIITGPTCYFRIDEMSPQEFIELAHANWTKRLHATSVYPMDSYSEQVKKCIQIAIIDCTDEFGEVYATDVHPTEAW
ncbi:hypothetical protein ACQ4PT_022780 [Festuca glaucescens]